MKPSRTIQIKNQLDLFEMFGFFSHHQSHPSQRFTITVRHFPDEIIPHNIPDELILIHAYQPKPNEFTLQTKRIEHDFIFPLWKLLRRQSIHKRIDQYSSHGAKAVVV